jgi:hypothetical protein
MIISKFAVLAFGARMSFGQTLDTFLNGNAVYIEQGHYLLHNEIDLAKIHRSILEGNNLAGILNEKSFSIPLLDEQKKGGVARIRRAVARNKDLLQTILEVDVGVSSRTTRAIELFGDLLHAIAGTPTGSQWRKNEQLVGHLKAAVDGQAELNKDFIRSLKEQGKHTLELDETAIALAKQSNWLSNEITGLTNLNKIIDTGIENQEIIREKLFTIQFILLEGRLGRLSAFLIDHAQLSKELDEITGIVSKRGLYPVYGKGDLQATYNLPNAITFIQDGKIHSVIAMPLVRRSEVYKAFTLNENLFSQPTRQTPRILLVERSGQFIAYITQDNMALCTKHKKIFVCDLRVVKIWDTEPMCVKQWGCGAQTIPKTIVVQTADEDKFIFNSNKAINASLVCDLGRSDNLELGMRGALRIPKNCELNSKAFKIQAKEDFSSGYKKDFELEQMAVPQIDHLGIEREEDSELIGNLSAQLSVHSAQFEAVNKEIESTNSKINSALNSTSSLESVANGTAWHFLPGYMSAGLGVICFIAILFLALRLLK